MINLTFPRQTLSSVKRKTLNTIQDYYKFINANINSNNLFTTVYNYTEFEGRWNKPVFDSAIIDRLWFDFDLDTILEDKTVIRNDCYSNMKKLHEWALKQDLKHICRYTGSGYDVTIFTKTHYIKNKKDCIKNAVIGICDELGIKSDAKTLGDIARVCRVTNSYNFKPKAKRFCIPLTQEMIDIGHKEIRKLAKQQHFTINSFGKKLLDIKKYDYTNNIEDTIMSKYDTSTISNVKIDDLSDTIPICIKYLLSKITPNYNERRVIIVGLRDLSFSIGETKQILQKYLSPQKFHHCVFEEGQLHHLYKSHKVIFPNQHEIVKLQACPHKLGEYCSNSKRGCMNYGRV
jgi:hypothetical protein